MHQTTSSKTFQALRYYVKELIVKTSHTPLVFNEEWKPAITLNFETQANRYPENHYEVILQAQVTTKLGERTILIIEAYQAGQFRLEGYDDSALDYALKVYCPGLLYPYLSRLLADATIQAGFPPLIVSPINFEQYYQKKKPVNETSN